MRFIDLIDIRIEQYRCFKVYLKLGCQEANIDLYDASSEVSAYLHSVETDDVIFIPPYGQAINLIRNENLNINNSIFMVDLKGPMGIDSVHMIQSKTSASVIYLSPMIGQEQFSDFFISLINSKIKCFPLPFFASDRLIEQLNILNQPYKRHDNTFQDSNMICFAGAVWGERLVYLEALKSVFGKRITVTCGLNPKDYSSLLRFSLACLDFPGNQNSTYRFSEIFLSGGLCLCQQRSMFVLEKPPINYQEILYFSNINELLKLSTFLLQNVDTSFKIRKAGIEWFHKTQTPQKLIYYLISLVRNEKNIEDYQIRSAGGHLWSL